MTYCISDIHGEYELFMRLLTKINYAESDRLIVCGDFIDKGTASVKLAKTIFGLPNAYCIMGNHEHTFLKYYVSQTQSERLDFDAVLLSLQQYFGKDGSLLDWDTVDMLVDLPYYMEDKDFVCVHAGIPMDKQNRILSPQDVAHEELVYDRRFKSPQILPTDSKCVCFGHTPTTYITSEPKILTYPRLGASANSQNIADYYKIHLDTGATVSGVLGCFCVDNCQTFYVKR